MTKKRKEYVGWFLFNSFLRERTFPEIEEDCVKIFQNFFRKSDYGHGIHLLRFDIYIEEEINYGRHNDEVYTKEHWTYLSCHLKNDVFIKADQQEKTKMALNTALHLLNFWKENLLQPKNFDLQKLITDYTIFLKSEKLFIENDNIFPLIIKARNSISFHFVITSTREVKQEKLYYDLNSIQDFINNKLVNHSFGESVKKFAIGYEIFDFNGEFAIVYKSSKDYKSYRSKFKWLVVVTQFDWKVISNQNKSDQYKELKNSILKGILSIEDMKRGPKDFKIVEFHEKMEEILNAYEIEYSA